MTKKDFFRIIIKLFGLYWLINTIFSLSQILYFANNAFGDWTGVAYSCFIVAFAVFLFIVLILKTDTIIRWLKLDKGFDDDRVEIPNFNVEKILILAIVLIGGMLILDNISILINQVYMAIRKVLDRSLGDLVTMNGYSTYQLTVSLVKVVLGYLLLTNYPFVSKLLIKTTQKKD